MDLYKKKMLKYRLRLLFVAFFILISASYMPLNLLIDKNNTIAFSQLEIVGAKVLPAIKGLLINTQRLRGLTASYKAGDNSLLVKVQQQSLIVKTKLQAAKEAVITANLKGITPLFASLSLKLKNTMDVALTQTQKKGFKNYSNVINGELALIVKIGDMSNLILDHDLDTFYLMNVVINKYPLAIEVAARLREIGSAVLTSKKVNKNTQIKLAILFGSLEDSVAAAKSGLDSAYSYNSSLKPIINPVFNKLSININRFKQEVKKVSEGDFSTNPTDFFQTATDVINNIASLSNLSNKNLLQLLNIRIKKMKVARDTVIVEGIIFLLILIVLFYMAHDYLYKNLLVREAAKKEQAILEELKKSK